MTHFRMCILGQHIAVKQSQFQIQSNGMPPEDTLARSQYSFKLAFYYRATLCVSAVFAVARCLSVRPSRSCILSTRLQMSSNFSVHPVAHHSSFLIPARVPNSKGTPLAGVHCTRGVGKFCNFLLKLPSISETVRDRPMVAMER